MAFFAVSYVTRYIAIYSYTDAVVLVGFLANLLFICPVMRDVYCCTNSGISL